MLWQVGDLAGLGEVVREAKEFVLARMEFRAAGPERDARAEGLRLKNREQFLKNKALELQNKVQELKIQNLKLQFKIRIRKLRKKTKRKK